jgi:CO dehydrogenase maturation factor
MCISVGSRTVVTGKGGVGKTTLVSCLATLLARRGRRVLTVDADPQMNLARALGLSAGEAAALRPLADDADYVEEKTGVRPGPGSMGKLFKLNPDVDDVIERFGVRTAGGPGLLVMGTVRQAGGGCLCAENVLLDSVIGRLGLVQGDHVLLDTQAGMEHFGRGLARGFSGCLVVSDDAVNALAVALRSAELARQSGILQVTLVVNKVRPGFEARLERFAAEAGAPLERSFGAIVPLPDDGRLSDLDPDVRRVLDLPDSAYAAALTVLADRLEPRDCGCSARRAAARARAAAHDHAHGDHHHGDGDHDHAPDGSVIPRARRQP